MHKDSTGHVVFVIKKGKIISLVKGSSAARNGLLTNHYVCEVNGQNVIGLKVSKAEHGSIPGPQGLGDREVVGRFVSVGGLLRSPQLQILILRLLQGFNETKVRELRAQCRH